MVSPLIEAIRRIGATALLELNERRLEQPEAETGTFLGTEPARSRAQFLSSTLARTTDHSILQTGSQPDGDFTFKVSPDGSTYYTSFVLNMICGTPSRATDMGTREHQNLKTLHLDRSAPMQ